METWEIKHFLFSREDDRRIYLYTKNTSQNGNLANDSYCALHLWFVDGELPENFIDNGKWQVHYPKGMYEWAVDLLMTKNPAYLNGDISKKRFFLCSSKESVSEVESQSIW
jgi:hypothetical protein